MRLLKGSELLQGSDHEFILTLYRQILNRGPDERGYRHFRDVLEADPGARRRIAEDMVASPEALRLGEEVLILWNQGASHGRAVEALSAEALLALFRQKFEKLDRPGRARLAPMLRECLALARKRRRWWPF
ncbi:MAG: DUF4214 domain-containing protein [Roseomonas sp.]|nr:DUF4214 domain-containing protein [Roseomonas sp.]